VTIPGPASDSALSPLLALESLVVDNPYLERLETLLGQFNIFEALGAVRVEARHSDFLGFLLSPQKNHGLGDAFARRLYERVLQRHQDRQGLVSPIAPPAAASWRRTDTVWRRSGTMTQAGCSVCSACARSSSSRQWRVLRVAEGETRRQTDIADGDSSWQTSGPAIHQSAPGFSPMWAGTATGPRSATLSSD